MQCISLFVLAVRQLRTSVCNEKIPYRVPMTYFFCCLSTVSILIHLLISYGPLCATYNFLNSVLKQVSIIFK